MRTSTASASPASWSPSRTASAATTCCRARRRCWPASRTAPARAREGGHLRAQRQAEGRRRGAGQEARLRQGHHQAQGGRAGQAVRLRHRAGHRRGAAAQGQQVDRRGIHLPEPIKTVGSHEVELRLHRDVAAKIKVEVVAE